MPISDARHAQLIGHIPDAADKFSDIFSAARLIAAHHRAEERHFAMSDVDQEIAVSCSRVALSSVIRHRSAPTAQGLTVGLPGVDCVIRVYQSKTPATIASVLRCEKRRN